MRERKLSVTPSPEPSPADAGTPRKKKILIVEDDQDMLSILCKVLQDKGYEVLGLPSAMAIVDGLHGNPDLFILDKNMDVIDGIAVSKYLRLKSGGRRVPIVMISGSDSEACAKAAGVDCYLEKPIDVSRLLAVIEHFTDDTQSIAIDRNNLSDGARLCG
ncbi:response regulator [Fulvivirgaceae bacterium PWU5]|uniref:Response regulator n=1 Tax=Dawidia cretensis TaxID=2782350 RepID=A0AAP2E400_9BACT|nr:response regulator [Dawidia cretensis]MBT1711729.1 response regulator [Dawidia cretensis]